MLASSSLSVRLPLGSALPYPTLPCTVRTARSPSRRVERSPAARPSRPERGVCSELVVADRCEAVCVLHVCYMCVSSVCLWALARAVRVSSPPSGLRSALLWGSGNGDPALSAGGFLLRPGGAGCPPPSGSAGVRGVPQVRRLCPKSRCSVGTRGKLWCPEAADLFRGSPRRRTRGSERWEYGLKGKPDPCGKTWKLFLFRSVWQ